MTGPERHLGEGALPKVLAIIPARGGSKEVPRKNIRVVAGKPLIAYTIETALAARHLFHRVIVSTDDPEIAQIAREHGADVPFLRPAELAGDHVPTAPVLQHAVRFVETQDNIVLDWVCLLQPTEPFRTVQDIEGALARGFAGGCDSVISVTQVLAVHPILMKRIEDDRLLPFVIEEKEGTRRQDYQPPAYMRNGAIYLTRRDVLMTKNSIWGEVIRPYVIPAERSVSVDTELDLKLVEILLAEREATRDGGEMSQKAPATPLKDDIQEPLERATGQLFSGLWGPYGQDLFEESVQLFSRRLTLAQFDRNWFQDKTCLDAGCGGGRNSIAMARLGAREVVGIDIGGDGLMDARRRATGMANVRFEPASILQIPFPDEKFDIVWCAGVLMITADEERALDELARVTKRGGYLYLLVYATGGMRWPLIQWLRPLAAQLGKAAVEEAIQVAGLPANKRRTFLDDLFCPRLDFYHWERLERMLNSRGFSHLQRWGPECRLDHEADLSAYRKDLEELAEIFVCGDRENVGDRGPLFRVGATATQATLDGIRWFEEAVRLGTLTSEEAVDRVIGQGHHRVLARKD